jgi:hypothetical protein
MHADNIRSIVDNGKSRYARFLTSTDKPTHSQRGEALSPRSPRNHSIGSSLETRSPFLHPEQHEPTAFTNVSSSQTTTTNSHIVKDHRHTVRRKEKTSHPTIGGRSTNFRSRQVFAPSDAAGSLVRSASRLSDPHADLFRSGPGRAHFSICRFRDLRSCCTCLAAGRREGNDRKRALSVPWNGCSRVWCRSLANCVIFLAWGPCVPYRHLR